MAASPLGLERRNVVDYVYSVDGDAIILGVRRLVTEIDFKRKLAVIVKRDVIVQSGTYPLSHYPSAVWPNIACLLGCDYIARVQGIGAITLFKTILPRWNGKEITVHIVSTTLNALTRNKVPIGYETQYSKAVNLYRFCPVLDDKGAISPLNPLPENGDWKELIGFDPHGTLAIEPRRYLDCRAFRSASFFTADGGALPAFNVPTYSLEDNPEVSCLVPLPVFAKIDFHQRPLSCLHSTVLQGFLLSRFGHTFAVDRVQLEEIARCAIDIRKKVLGPEIAPKQISEWEVSEVLTPKSPESGWLNRYQAYRCIKEKLKIRDDSIQKFYPKKNESNRNRALELVKNGNVTVTVCYQVCLAKDGSNVYLFKLICIPSVKTTAISANENNNREVDGYRVFMAFDAEGEILAYPYSCCGCYDGRGFCSHLLAMLFAFGEIKRCHNMNFFLKGLAESSDLNTRNTNPY